jgi:Fic family protein
LPPKGWRDQIHENEGNARFCEYCKKGRRASKETDCGKYTSITGASPATATRGLIALVDKNALVRAGERQHVHYALAIPLDPVASVMIDARGDIE